MIGGNYIQCLVIIVIFLGLKGEKKVGGFHNHDMEVASHKGDGGGGISCGFLLKGVNTAIENS